MARAKLHMICGNCGCNDMFTIKIDPHGVDLGLGAFEPEVYVTCGNCSTSHPLSHNADFSKEESHLSSLTASEPSPEDIIMIDAFRNDIVKADLNCEESALIPVYKGLKDRGILNYEYDTMDDVVVFALTQKGLKMAEVVDEKWKHWRLKKSK